MGANFNITPPLLKEILMTTDLTTKNTPRLKFHRCIPSCYTFPATGNPDTTKPHVTEEVQHNADKHFLLGGLSLHLIASHVTHYDWPFGTLPFGFFWSNLDTGDLETYPGTYSGCHF